MARVANMFKQIASKIHEVRPLIHCITNYVSANDCANVLLACGASPIMADDVHEVEEITASAQALVLNLGTPNESKFISMLKAGQKANNLGIPVIFDPVGIGASQFRKDLAKTLLKEVSFSVIRGNASEITTLATWQNHSSCIDTNALKRPSYDMLIELAKNLSEKLGAIIVISGEEDIISSPHITYRVFHGHPAMSTITGTGCMLTSLIGAYCGANPTQLLQATLAATLAMGLSGEQAYSKLCQIQGGTGSMHILLIDAISLLDFSKVEGGLNYELYEKLS